MLSSRRSLQRRLVSYALALAYVVTIAAGGILLVQNDRLTRQEVLSSLGLNLIAAAVFGLIFAAVATKVQERALDENMEERLAELSGEIIRAMAESNRAYVPSATYTPMDSFDHAFNRDLSLSMSKTFFYGFRGPSPRYVAARLRTAKHHPQHVRICMLDPQRGKAVARRAADRRARPTSKGRTLDQLVEEMRTELIMSVVALFDCRRICPIEISFGPETGTTRAELFDDEAFVTWYHGLPSVGHTFPESIRFPSGALMYETTKLEINRQFEISDNCVTFHSGHTDDDLRAWLERLTGEPFDSTRIVALREQYDRFIGDFEQHLAQVAPR